MIIDEEFAAEHRPKVGRKPLPQGSRRKMYSTRLHPEVIEGLKILKNLQGKPIARIIEGLISNEMKRVGL